MADTDPLEITCPRRGQLATVRFYGPCPACRSELAATMGGAGREVDAAYKAKANVVPNHVATKD